MGDTNVAALYGGFGGMNHGQPVDPPRPIPNYQNDPNYRAWLASKGTTLNTPPPATPAYQLTDMSKYLQAAPASVPYAQNYYAPQMRGPMAPQPGVGPGPAPIPGGHSSALTDFLAKFRQLGIGGIGGAV